MRTKDRGIGIKKNGTVFVRIFDGGKPVIRHIGHKDQPGVMAEARTVLERLRNLKRQDKLGIEQVEKRILFRDAAQLWLEKDEYKWKHSVPCLIEYFGRLWYDEISHLEVVGFRKWATVKRERPINDATVNRYLTGMSAMWNDLQTLRAIKKIDPIKMPLYNPVKIARKEQWYDETNNRRTRVVTQEEFRSLYQDATPRIRRMILAALNSALRRKDIWELDKDTIDKYTEQLRGLQNKISKSYTLPANSIVRDLLDNGPLDPTNFRREWDATRARHKAKGYDDLWMTDLRRTAATEVWETTHNILLCRDLLGHRDVKTTQLYLGLRDSDINKAGEILENKFAPPKTELKVVG